MDMEILGSTYNYVNVRRNQSRPSSGRPVVVALIKGVPSTISEPQGRVEENDATVHYSELSLWDHNAGNLATSVSG